MQDRDYLVQIRLERRTRYAFVYDRELIEEKDAVFSGKKVDHQCSAEELSTLIGGCSSVNLYGRKAVRRGIEEGYVHPDSVGEVNGIPTAMYIRV
ncbi:MAG: DUF424 family protein [Candidatus Geothermarchaeales archaeon]